MAYKQLTFIQRCRIYGLWRAGHTQTDIAKEIGVHKSTISRELYRNITPIRTKLGCWQYKPNYAQAYTDERHKRKPKRVKLTEEVKSFVREKLKEEWSPDQISGYGKRHQLFSISHEWIYQFILKDKQLGGDLYRHLRHQHKKYRKRYGGPTKEVIRNRRSIDERPKIVDNKTRVGDWEVDTIIGKDRKQSVVSLVERAFKKTILKKVQVKTAQLVSEAIIDALTPVSPQVFTITSNNGKEFMFHEMVSQRLEADFYFAHPYASWERGLNENTNGLVRQYLKKGSDFTNITDKDLLVIMDKLNNRPRKTLQYATPNEIFVDT